MTPNYLLTTSLRSASESRKSFARCSTTDCRRAPALEMVNREYQVDDGRCRHYCVSWRTAGGMDGALPQLATTILLNCTGCTHLIVSRYLLCHRVQWLLTEMWSTAAAGRRCGWSAKSRWIGTSQRLARSPAANAQMYWNRTLPASSAGVVAEACPFYLQQTPWAPMSQQECHRIDLATGGSTAPVVPNPFHRIQFRQNTPFLSAGPFRSLVQWCFTCKLSLSFPFLSLFNDAFTCKLSLSFPFLSLFNDALNFPFLPVPFLVQMMH